MLDSARHAGRLLAILRTLGRFDALFVLDEAPLPGPARWIVKVLAGPPSKDRLPQRKGERLAAALHDLGPSFIKLGQALSVRADLVGEEIAADLAHLRDRLPPAPWPAAEAILIGELGTEAASSFEAFDPVAVAAASIAQVHFARVGEEPVAVKILRPGIEAAIQRDLELFSWLADTAERHIPASRRLRPKDVIGTLADTVAQEMDLRFEAAAASELAENFASDPRFKVPRIRWPLTARRVLTMERVEGIPIDDLAALSSHGHDLKKLAERVIQIFLIQALEHGFFHADMHQGNLFVGADGAIIAVDFGIMGRLDRTSRLFMAEMLHAFLTGDWRRAAEVHFRAGYVPADKSLDAFALACRAIGEPILDRPVKEISLGRLLAQLFQITELFGMRTQPHLLLLQKTMVTVEGVARRLDPDVNFWEASRPVIQPWAEANLSPEARLQDVVMEALREMPQILRNFRQRSESPPGQAALILAKPRSDASPLARYGWPLLAVLFFLLWLFSRA